MEKKCDFRLRKDGSFRVLHLTDIQETMYPRKDTVCLLHALIKAADPDLIILTGDQVKGYSLLFRILGAHGAKMAIQWQAGCLERHGIPFAVTFGNHDAQCGLSNEEQARVYRTFTHAICPDEGAGSGTFCLSVKGDEAQEVLRLYILDSGNKREKGRYLPPEPEVLGWLKKTLQNYTGVPSVVFQHIPLPEYKECKNVKIQEPICSPEQNAGEFDILREHGNVLAVFCGHDHKNDFLGEKDGITLGYTPSCGFASYGPGAQRGGRLLVFRADGQNRMTCQTKLLHYADLIAPHTRHRLKEYLDTHVMTCWPPVKQEKKKEKPEKDRREKSGKSKWKNKRT